MNLNKQANYTSLYVYMSLELLLKVQTDLRNRVWGFTGIEMFLGLKYAHEQFYGFIPPPPPPPNHGPG